MSTTLSDLTVAVLDTLAATPGLAAVRLANQSHPPDGIALPAGVLVMLDATAQDDIDRLTRVRFELTLWRRDIDPQANVLALAELADAASDTLLAEPTLGGLAVPGASGAATEIARLAPARADPPLACLAMHVVCHVLAADALAPQPAEKLVLIDQQPVLASGPHMLTVGPFAKRRLDRTFAGLDGVVSIDLGATTRPITIAGRLVADTADDLLDQMAALAGLNSSADLLTLAVGDGRTFSNVRLEDIRWGRMLAPGGEQRSAIAYQMQLSQLAW